MCTSRKIINRSKNGIMTYCNNSKLFQLLFNNLCFELFEWELETLKEHILSIDIAYWEDRLQCAASNRRIPISVGVKHFIILINKRELKELKNLLDNKPKEVSLLHLKDIEYNGLLN